MRPRTRRNLFDSRARRRLPAPQPDCDDALAVDASRREARREARRHPAG